jgi:hypothetical protein
MKDKFLHYKLIGDAIIQCNHGFILPSKVRKLDYQNIKHIGILYNLVKICQWKKLLECWKAYLEFY